MATIYRFIVEGASSSKGERKSRKKKEKGTGKTTSLLKVLGGSENGGVESNRKLRAINPVLNKLTNGYWEKATRIGRAGLGIVKLKKVGDTYKFAGLSGTAVAIIVSFVLQTVMQHQARLIAKREKENAQNYKAMENGVSANHGEYKVVSNWWSGKISYNENK